MFFFDDSVVAYFVGATQMLTEKDGSECSIRPSRLSIMIGSKPDTFRQNTRGMFYQNDVAIFPEKPH